MKSRYSAYAAGEAAYIQRTTHPEHPDWSEDRESWRREILAFSRGRSFWGWRFAPIVRRERKAGSISSPGSPRVRWKSAAIFSCGRDAGSTTRPSRRGSVPLPLPGTEAAEVSPPPNPLHPRVIQS